MFIHLKLLHDLEAVVSELMGMWKNPHKAVIDCITQPVLDSVGVISLKLQSLLRSRHIL